MNGENYRLSRKAELGRWVYHDGYGATTGAMNTESPQERRHTSGNLSAFVTSFCAAIVVRGPRDRITGRHSLD